MKNFLSLFLLSSVFLLLPKTVKAQNGLLGITSGSDFKRELDNFNSMYYSNWDFIKGNHRIGYSSSIQSRLFLFNKTPQNIQDETKVASWYSYQFNPAFALFTEGDYYFFTNTQVQTYQLKAGLTWTNKFIKLSPFGGWVSDTRSKRSDNGFLWGINALTKEFDLGDNFYSTFEGATRTSDLNPRTYQSSAIKNKSRYQTEELQLVLNSAYSFNQRDSYQPSSFFNRDINDIIEKVLSDSSSFAFTATTQLSKELNLRLDINSLYNVRNFENTPLTETTSNSILDTRYTRQEITAISTFDYVFDWGKGSIGTRYALSGLDAKITRSLNVTSEILKRRDEQLKNTFYDQETVELFVKNESRLTQNQTLQTSGTLSILRFDTPESNFDDRDELFTAFDIEHRYTTLQSFETSLLFSAEAYHRVFLFSQRSMENNWRRSLRLQPGITWLPTPSLRWYNQFLVRANYTVYDFTDVEGTVRDQSSREWGLSSEIKWEFAKNWFHSWLISRNQLVIGQLFWDDFSETPIDTLTTTRIESAIEMQKGQTYIKLGIRVFIKDDYVPATILRLSENEQTLSRLTTGNQQTLQWGPMLTVRWTSSRYGEISLDGWLQLQYLKNSWYIQVPDDFSRALEVDQNYRRTRIFPNLAIRTKLYL